MESNIFYSLLVTENSIILMFSSHGKSEIFFVAKLEGTLIHKQTIGHQFFFWSYTCNNIQFYQD